MYRTGQSAARPTATGTPHGGRSATAADPARAQPAGAVGGAKPQRAAANGNRAGGNRSPGTG